MNILILVAAKGWGFVNQAEWLSIGLKKNNCQVRILQVDEQRQWQTSSNDFDSDLILAIGSWDSYYELIEQPRLANSKVIPWITCEGTGEQFVEQYNSLPLILTTSRHCQRYFQQQGINNQLIVVVPEAVDDTFWCPVDRAISRKVFDLLSIRSEEIQHPSQIAFEETVAQDGSVLLTIGGDGTSKGVRETMKALAKIDQPWFYIVKIWPSPNALRLAAEEIELARSLHIYERIKYVVGTFSSEFLRDLINLADIYVAPSRWEGFGLPLVQAQLCGKPVITTNAAAAGETVINNETGLIAESVSVDDGRRADVEDLGRCLRTLISNRQLREEMGNKAIIHAKRTYSPEVVGRQMVNIFDKFLRS